jgi:hypothetical protein
MGFKTMPKNQQKKKAPESAEDGSREVPSEQQKKKTHQSAQDAVRCARKHVTDVTGLECESIAGVEHEKDGWTITAVVVELRRIPSTTDILGTYEVRVADNGELLKCRRVERYNRNQALAGQQT